MLTYGGWNGRRTSPNCEAVGTSIEHCSGASQSLQGYASQSPTHARGLGLSGLIRSEAVAADLMMRAGGRRAAGDQPADRYFSTDFGERHNARARAITRWGRLLFVMCSDIRWNERWSTPTNALLVQVR